VERRVCPHWTRQKAWKVPLSSVLWVHSNLKMSQLTLGQGGHPVATADHGLLSPTLHCLGT
jgi:hypothetical protein